MLAAYGFPGKLRALIGNTMELLQGTGMAPDIFYFVGKDPRAIAELYYGHAPSEQELSLFIAKFFKGAQV